MARVRPAFRPSLLKTMRGARRAVARAEVLMPERRVPVTGPFAKPDLLLHDRGATYEQPLGPSLPVRVGRPSAACQWQSKIAHFLQIRVVGGVDLVLGLGEGSGVGRRERSESPAPERAPHPWPATSHWVVPGESP